MLQSFSTKIQNLPYQNSQSMGQVQVQRPKSPTVNLTRTPVDNISRPMLEFHLRKSEQIKFDGSMYNYLSSLCVHALTALLRSYALEH